MWRMRSHEYPDSVNNFKLTLSISTLFPQEERMRKNSKKLRKEIKDVINGSSATGSTTSSSQGEGLEVTEGLEAGPGQGSEASPAPKKRTRRPKAAIEIGEQSEAADPKTATAPKAPKKR